MKVGFFSSSLNGMAAAWEMVVIDGTEVKMQVDTGADTTVLLCRFCIWEKLERPTLDGTARTLEANDGHKLYFKRTAFCDLTWNARNYSTLRLAIVRSNKDFEFLERDLSPTST